MYGRRLLTVNHNVPDENEIETKPKERYEYLKRIMMQFWKMFQQQYLNSLRERDAGKTFTVDIDVRDVVLIKNRGTLLEMNGLWVELKDSFTRKIR